MLAARSAGAGVKRTRSASGRAGGSSGLPVLDMMEVIVSNRDGCRMASICAIMPPIEAPTTWARAMSSDSSR